VTSVSLPPHRDPRSLIATERSVYFDFDDFAIKTQYGALVERHGKYLASNPALSVRIEGHCDERGGREYNLALGQRRAEALARALRVYGVKDGQLETLSWGEDKPLATGQDETSWAKNRRADIEYPTR
jgi:peptidoglycan-associated lipoprotein